MFARDSVIPFLRYHFQILFSMIMSQPLQKICRNVYPTSLHLLLEFIIPSPGEEICQVEFFLVQFYNFNNCFKFYYFVEATWKDFNRGPFEKLKITSPPAALLVFHFFKPVPSLLLMNNFCTSIPCPAWILWFQQSKTLLDINCMACIFSRPWQ